MAATMCMSFPNTVNVNNLISQAMTHERNNRIDNTLNLRGDRVFIFHGTVDSVVLPGWLSFFVNLFVTYFIKFLELN